jgi:hypothetical protein
MNSYQAVAVQVYERATEHRQRWAQITALVQQHETLGDLSERSLPSRQESCQCPTAGQRGKVSRVAKQAAQLGISLAVLCSSFVSRWGVVPVPPQSCVLGEPEA